MSHILDQAACADTQRREDLARSDAAMVASMFPLGGSNLHPIFRAALAPFTPPQFLEAELIAADLAANVDKAAKAHARNDAGAAAADLQWLDAKRRGGAL